MDVWIERYAELLGCENRPAAVAAAIESLKATVDRIPEEMARNRREATDGLILRMRRYAVNCGASSVCWVSKQMRTTQEQACEANELD